MNALLPAAAGLTGTIKHRPRKRRSCLLVVISLLVASLPVAARQASPKRENRESQSPAERPRSRPSEKSALERSKALEQVHAFVVRAQSLQDVSVKIDSLIALAALLWKEGGDAEYARQIFVDAHNLLKNIQPQEGQEPPSGGNPVKAGLPPSRKTLRLLRKRLVVNLARFDPALANRLANEQDGYLETPLQSDEVKEQTREQIARQDFDKYSGKTHLSQFDSMVILSLLDELRKKDVKAGDELFLTTLSRLRANPNVEANALLILGNYLFSGHPLPSNESFNRITVSPVQVGGVTLAADVVLNRDNFTRSLASPYLTTAAEVLSRPADGVDEQRRYSAAAFLLLPKAREFAPQFVATFAAVTQRSDAGLKTGADGQSEVKRWANEKVDVESQLSQIRKTVGTKEHDRICLTAASQYSAQNDLDAALRVANEMSDEAARGKLLSVINFKQASNYLKGGDFLRAEQTAARISSETIRALLFAGLSAAHLRAARIDSAKVAINNVIADARKSTESRRRPSLLLMAAASLSKDDAAYALQLFREALDALDAAGHPGRSPLIVDFGWVETVSVEGQAVRFELPPGTGQTSYPELLTNLFAADERSMVSTVLELKTEALLSAHLVAAGRILLERTRKETSRSAAP